MPPLWFHCVAWEDRVRIFWRFPQVVDEIAAGQARTAIVRSVWGTHRPEDHEHLTRRHRWHDGAWEEGVNDAWVHLPHPPEFPEPPAFVPFWAVLHRTALAGIVLSERDGLAYIQRVRDNWQRRGLVIPALQHEHLVVSLCRVDEHGVPHPVDDDDDDAQG